MSEGALGDDSVSQNAGTPLTGAEDGATNAPEDSGGMPFDACCALYLDCNRSFAHRLYKPCPEVADWH